MALATCDAFALSQHATFCPPPLHIQKKLCRATFHKRIFRKSSHHRHNDQYVYGPLDDIIDEIKSNIWGSPHDCSTDASLLDWANPLEVPSTWTVTPLPVSRLPSDQPLTVRKNRESRSSTSGSSMGDPIHFPRSGSRDDPFDGGPVGTASSVGTAPWPLLDACTSYESTHAPNTTETIGYFNITGVQGALEHADHNVGDRPVPTKRRPSRLRLFTGLTRLRRTETAETSGGSGDSSELASPATATSFEAHEVDRIGEEVLQEPSDDAVEAYVRKNARK
jgi:hypothetical protein